MKLLESNGVSQSAFSGIATNYLNSEFQNGYLKYVLNECDIVKVSSNTITINTGFIFFQGLRIFFDEVYTITIPNFPASTLLYHLIVEVVVDSTGDNTIEVKHRPIEALRRDNILKDMSGTYQLELATFTLTNSGITEFTKTIQPIVLTNEELEGFKNQINDLSTEFKEIKQTIITANDDAADALTTITNFRIGKVNSGESASAETIVDRVGKGITLNLVLPKGDKGEPGTPGANGSPGQPGAPGVDGKTPYIQDGYWFIDGKNTNVKAEASAAAIDSIQRSGTSGVNYDTYKITFKDQTYLTFTVYRPKFTLSGTTLTITD